MRKMRKKEISRLRLLRLFAANPKSAIRNPQSAIRNGQIPALTPGAASGSLHHHLK
jgi:hypothetical protein